MHDRAIVFLNKYCRRIRCTMENMIIKLQEIVSHQGEEILSLGDELYKQQAEIGVLKKKLVKLEAKFHAAAESGADFISDNEPPPPHY